MAKSFIYQGETFTPLSQCDGSNWILHTMKEQKLADITNIFPNGWSHKDFYDAARKAGCGDYDIFIHNGNECLPCGGTLLERNSTTHL